MITHSRLLEALHYDPVNGSWTLLVKRRGSVPGSRADRLTRPGYRVISIDGETYHSAPLAYFYMTGEWPPGDIDHVDCDRSNDRWANLRKATRSQNLANRPPQKNCKSGLKGVSWNKPTGKWLAQIQINGKVKNLGRFTSKEAAHAAYRTASFEFFGEFARAA